jgi:hypothetical protein
MRQAADIDTSRMRMPSRANRFPEGCFSAI